jgi:hypothetical protein
VEVKKKEREREREMNEYKEFFVMDNDSPMRLSFHALSKKPSTFI